MLKVGVQIMPAIMAQSSRQHRPAYPCAIIAARPSTDIYRKGFPRCELRLKARLACLREMEGVLDGFEKQPRPRGRNSPGQDGKQAGRRRPKQPDQLNLTTAHQFCLALSVHSSPLPTPCTAPLPLVLPLPAWKSSSSLDRSSSSNIPCDSPFRPANRDV